MRKCKHCCARVAKPDLRRSGFCSFECKQQYNKPTANIKELAPKTPELPPINLTPIKKVNKEVQLQRDVKYLEFIRTLPCTVCKTKSVIHAHHANTGGMGIKGSDYSAIPLCVNHHTSGNDAIHKIGKTKFLIKFNIDLESLHKKLYDLYCKKIKNR